MKSCHIAVFAVLVSLQGCAPSLYSEAGREKLAEVSTRLDTIDFEVWWGNDLIWQGAGQVNRFTPTNQSLKITEADLPTCQPWGGSRDREASVRFYKYGGNYRDPDTYKFEVTLTQSKASRDCGGEPSKDSRGERTAKLRRGQTLEVTGDNGLRMIVRRP
jgi:hypothetical protein